ncbi:transketolase family protein [candidate division KSB1 bacterium]
MIALREAAGIALTRLAEKYPDFVVLDADIAGGTGMHHFRVAHPDRFIQCGIAEQNMMGIAAGLATCGFIPFVTSFSVFLSMRALEQARTTVAYPRLNVKIIGAHPGLDTGPDGVSAQAIEDIGIYRSVPGFVVISPCDQIEVDKALEAMLNYDGPVFMRTGRSPVPNVCSDDYQFEIGKGVVLEEGGDVTIMATGIMVHTALEAAAIMKKDGVSVRVVNISTVKPIDKDLIVRCAGETAGIVTVEDHNKYGGLGSAVAQVMATNNLTGLEIIAIDDVFGESGEAPELHQKYGLNTESIIAAAARLLKKG